MTRMIKANSVEDIRNINEIATRFGYDVWIHGKSVLADAKSLLGLMTLDWKTDELRVVTEDNVDPKFLYKAMSKYLVD